MSSIKPAALDFRALIFDKMMRLFNASDMKIEEPLTP